MLADALIKGGDDSVIQLTSLLKKDKLPGLILKENQFNKFVDSLVMKHPVE
jgi:hypothetical protein